MGGLTLLFHLYATSSWFIQQWHTTSSTYEDKLKLICVTEFTVILIGLTDAALLLCASEVQTSTVCDFQRRLQTAHYASFSSVWRTGNDITLRWKICSLRKLSGKKWQKKGIIIPQLLPTHSYRTTIKQMARHKCESIPIDSATGANQSAGADDFDDDRTQS